MDFFQFVHSVNEKQKTSTSSLNGPKKDKLVQNCQEPGLNWWHKDFQSSALPLSYPGFFYLSFIVTFWKNSFNFIKNFKFFIPSKIEKMRTNWFFSFFHLKNLQEKTTTNTFK